jgi:hypothetical protein
MQIEHRHQRPFGWQPGSRIAHHAGTPTIVWASGNLSRVELSLPGVRLNDAMLDRYEARAILHRSIARTSSVARMYRMSTHNRRYTPCILL